MLKILKITISLNEHPTNSISNCHFDKLELRLSIKNTLFWLGINKEVLIIGLKEKNVYKYF